MTLTIALERYERHLALTENRVAAPDEMRVQFGSDPWLTGLAANRAFLERLLFVERR